MAMTARPDEGWSWRARQRVAAWLPPEAAVEAISTQDDGAGCIVRATGRLGDVEIEWWAAGATPDAALDELIVHVRRTPGEMLARAYRHAVPRRVASIPVGAIAEPAPEIVADTTRPPP
jgi:hypothetical protein